MNKKWFEVFKYSIYLFLCANIFLFLRKEWLASFHRYPDGFGVEKIIEVYASTIDTLSWFILLMLFELETYTLSDQQLKGNLKWLLRAVRAFCFAFIVYTFWGYLSIYIWNLSFEPIEIASVCDWLGHSWMMDNDTFKTIDAENCNILAQSESYFKYKGEDIYTDGETLHLTTMLCLLGVVNSLTWILIVIILEIDVWLQLNHRFAGRAFLLSKYSKNTFYTILIIAAIFWGVTGKFLDFWDAFMWIVAFFFIENNLLNWKKETELA
jgi:hypothetical protein